MARTSMSTATAAERRTAMGAVRGALQVLHNAANLVKLVDAEAERMLRTAEGLARSSVARVEHVNRIAAATKLSAEAASKGTPAPAAPAPAAAARPARRRAKHSKKKKKAASSMNVDGDDGGGEELPLAGGAEDLGTAVVHTCEPPPSAPSRVPRAQPARERSPRREAFGAAPASSTPSATTTGTAAPVAVGAYHANQVIRLIGLVNRPELIGARAEIRRYDADADRYEVMIVSTQDMARVKEANITRTVFGLLPVA